MRVSGNVDDVDNVDRKQYMNYVFESNPHI